MPAWVSVSVHAQGCPLPPQPLVARKAGADRHVGPQLHNSRVKARAPDEAVTQGSPTCEDGDAVETAVQLAQEDGEEAVGGQASHVPCALVIDHHVLVLLRLHLQGNGKNPVSEKQAER